MLKTVSSISNVIGALNYKGTWNANSNVPVLSSGVGTKGDYYVVSTAGSTNLDGTTLWGVGDWAVFNGSIWQKVDGGDTSAVTSLTVTGLTGYMYANNTSPVTASLTIPVSNVTGAVPNTVNVIAGTNLTGGGALTGNVTINNPYNGSVTNVATGTGLTGGPITTTGTISLANTAVTTGSYGNASTVATYTVNAQGQLTATSNTSIAIDAAAVTTGTLAVARGGTNIGSYTIGDLIYASGTTTLAKLADVATGSVLVSGGVGAAPAYSASPTLTSVTAGTLTSSGNLTFTGTGNRITGDFGNATNASRVIFQNSTVNGGSRISVIPNGTASSSGFEAYSGPNVDPNNTSIAVMAAQGTTDVRFSSTISGTGTYLPMTFYTNGSESARIATNGNVGIGTSSPNASAILDAQSTTKGVRFPNMTTTQKNAISSPAAGLVVFDTTLAKLCVYSGAAWQTITSV
jgi:hypothetical protein